MSFVVRLAYRHALIFLADDRRIMVAGSGNRRDGNQELGFGTGMGMGRLEDQRGTLERSLARCDLPGGGSLGMFVS